VPSPQAESESRAAEAGASTRRKERIPRILLVLFAGATEKAGLDDLRPSLGEELDSARGPL
jgi:hypothetical protein